MGKSLAVTKNLESLAVGILSFLFLLFTVSPMLPVVMQDEFVYRNQVVYAAMVDYDYPGYLFGAFALIAELAGDGFYAGLKIANSFVAAMAAAVLYFVVEKLSSRWLAIGGALVFLVIPSMFQASFYMPDMFVSSFLLIAASLVMLGLQESRVAKNLIWVFAGISLLLAFLSKPHALIALAAFLLFGVLQTFRERRFSPVLISVGIAIVGRLVLGVLLAGTAGLNVFGRSYSEGLFSAPFVEGSFVASGVIAAAPEASGIAKPAWSFLWEFFQLFAVFGLFSLGLFVLLLARAFRSNLNLFLAVLTLTSLGAIALFESLVGLQGDDHSDRILTRHIEYLIPLLLVFGYSEIRQFRPSSRLFLIVIPLVAAVAGAGLWALSQLPLHRVSDGAIVLLSGRWSGGYVLLVVALAFAFWFGHLMNFKSLPLLAIFGLAFTSTSAGFDVRNDFSSTISADLAGKELAGLGSLKDRTVLVVSASKQNSEVFRFYTLPRNSSQKIVASGSVIDVSDLEEPGLVLLPLEGVQLVSSCEPVVGEHFVYYDCDNLR